MDTREKIIDFLRSSGPIIPVKLARELNTNILMASAFLSELVSSGKIKVSNLKVGGTPLYYYPGHEYKLQNFSNNIQQKEKMVYDELYSKKVLIDRELEPLYRVAIRELKDFAVPLTIENELYWKWYLIPDSEVINLISIKRQTVLELPKETQFAKDALSKTEIPIESQLQSITLQNQSPSGESEEKKPDDFLLIVREYFKQNNIEIGELRVKKSDIECLVKVPSVIGTILCYCRARIKKRITDADISSAYMQSQYKGLPLLFLYRGEITKKAEMMIREYMGIIIKGL